jgi:hypothetical protein
MRARVAVVAILCTLADAGAFNAGVRDRTPIAVVARNAVLWGRHAVAAAASLDPTLARVIPANGAVVARRVLADRLRGRVHDYAAVHGARVAVVAISLGALAYSADAAIIHGAQQFVIAGDGRVIGYGGVLAFAGNAYIVRARVVIRIPPVAMPLSGGVLAKAVDALIPRTSVVVVAVAGQVLCGSQKGPIGHVRDRNGPIRAKGQ